MDVLDNVGTACVELVDGGLGSVQGGVCVIGTGDVSGRLTRCFRSSSFGVTGAGESLDAEATRWLEV